MMNREKMILLLLCGVVFTTATNDTSILGSVVKVCPGKKLCRENVTVQTTKYTEGFTSCCTDCSCEEACGTNCCFPSQHSMGDDVDEQCMFLTTREPEKRDELHFMSFYVVTNPPANGCLENPDVNNITYSYSGMANVDERDSFPVFSKRLGKIFINRSIALCNGEKNVSQFKPHLFCTIIRSHIKGANRFYLFTSSIEHPEQFSNCYKEYIYEGVEDDIAPRICYRNLISSCNDTSYFIGDDLLMNEDDVKRACSSGLVLPYVSSPRVYANPFCAMCNGVKVTKSKVCNLYRYEKSESFSRLIAISKDADVKKTRKVDETPKERVACEDYNSSKVHCREILCPVGHLKANDNRCIWTFPEFWSPFHFYFNLKSQETITADELKRITQLASSTKRISYDWLRTPVPFTFSSIDMIFQKDSDKFIDLLIVRFDFDKKEDYNIGFVDVLETIKKSLQRPWTATLSNRTIPLVPSIGRSLRKAKIRHTESLDEAFLISGRIGFELNKMFFCEQIELNTNEYTINYAAGYKTLTYNGYNRRFVFFTNEFVYLDVSESNGKKASARVCIEDTNFKVNERGNALLQYGYTSMVKLMVIIVYFVK